MTWSERLRSSSLQMNLGIIAANWAIWGNIHELRKHWLAETSLVLVGVGVLLDLCVAYWITELLYQRYRYAAGDDNRWNTEALESDQFSGVPNHPKQAEYRYFPFTMFIERGSQFFRFGRLLFPTLGACALVAAILCSRNQIEEAIAPNTETTQAPAILQVGFMAGFVPGDTLLSGADLATFYGGRWRRMLDDDTTGALSFIVIGHVDKRPLKAGPQNIYGSNEALALARAGVVRRILLASVDPAKCESLDQRIVLLSSSAWHIGTAVDSVGLAQDRSVVVYALVARAIVNQRKVSTRATATTAMAGMGTTALSAGPVDWNEADFLGAAFGAFLGFLLALVILLIERWINWFQQRADRKHLVKDIQVLIEKECSAARDAAEHYEALASGYTAQPYMMQPRPIHVNVGLRALDRMDRQVILAALRRIAGRDKGWELWRELLRFVDGLCTHYPFQETAILSSMVDMNTVAQAYDQHTRQVHLWAATIGDEVQRTGPEGLALAGQIHGILAKTHNIGFVPMTDLHSLLILPLSELFKTSELNLRNALPLAEEHTKARAAYARYGEITRVLAQSLRAFARNLNETATEGERLRDRMKDAMN